MINKQKGNVKYTIKCIPNEAGENNKQEMIVTLMPNEAGGNNKQDLIVTLVPKKGLEINKQEDKVELDFDNRLDELVASMDDFLYWNKIKIRIDDIHYKAMVNYKQEAKVESFYVPYFSEDSGNEKMVLLEEGKDFNGGEVTAPDEFTDEETGDEMEMDVIESKYFKFLNK